MATAPAGSPRPRRRWPEAAAGLLVLGSFALVLRRRWHEVQATSWHLQAGWLALSGVLLALSYALAGLLWAWALRGVAGRPGLARGVRIWFAANLARYVPGNLWSFVGAAELARRDGVARRTTLAVMAVTQVLSIAVGLAVGLPVLVAERQRYGRVALLAAAALLGVALLVLALRGRLAALLRRRYPGVRRGDLLPGRGRALALTGGYLLYWALTGLAFAAFVRSVHPLGVRDVPLAVAAYAAAYAVGFLSLVAPAGLAVREGALTVALAPLLPPAAALVVAVLSRVWMMLVELAGALAAHALDARLAARAADPGRAAAPSVPGLPRGDDPPGA